MEPSISVGIVAPAWLHEPLTVLLEAAPAMELWACATAAEYLLTVHGDEPADLVLVYVSRASEAEQIGQIKATWPGARCIALLEHSRQRELAAEAGADWVLVEGVAPSRLLQTIEELHLGMGVESTGADAA